MLSFYISFVFGHLNFSLVNPSAGVANVSISYIGISQYPSYTMTYPCSNSDSCTPYQTTVPPGTYLFEVWGASGGDIVARNFFGGFGGYSVSVITVSINSKIFIHLGGKGFPGGIYASKTNGGYNGGGYGGFGSVSSRSGGGGGGASDFRIGIDHVGSRFVVAGGGGGASYYVPGGHAGGIEGLPGGDVNTDGLGGGGGTSTTGGYSTTLDSSSPGSYGSGGEGASVSGYFGGGGGGAGYFGGGGGYHTATADTRVGGGGGGSSYSQQNPDVFLKGFLPGTSSGLHTFPSPWGGYEKGHIGNGVARLTIVDDSTDQFAYLMTLSNNRSLLSLSHVLFLSFTLLFSNIF